MFDWGVLALRIGLGIVFVAHGLQKVFGLFGGPGMEKFSQMLSGLGFTPAIIWAYVAAYTELLGGLCLLSGLFARAASAFILILIIVATVKVHLAKGFFLSAGGFEYNLLIACVCIALMLLGAGKFRIRKKGK